MCENKCEGQDFGPKREEVTEGHKKIADVIRMFRRRKMRCVGHVVLMVKIRNACEILIGNPERERPFGRCGNSWKDNIKFDLIEIGREDVE